MPGHPGMSFGLIGGLIAAADMNGKSTRLTETLDPRVTQFRKHFSDALLASLQRNGYETEVIVTGKDEEPDKMVSSVRSQAKSDVILGVQLFVRYVAAGVSSDYVPMVLAKVKGVDTKTSKIVYSDEFIYGYNAPGGEAAHIASDDMYRFSNMDALLADPAKTRNGLYDGANRIAAQIAEDFRR